MNSMDVEIYVSQYPHSLSSPAATTVTGDASSPGGPSMYQSALPVGRYSPKGMERTKSAVDGRLSFSRSAARTLTLASLNGVLKYKKSSQSTVSFS